MSNRKKILKELKELRERMQGRIPGTCRGCPLLIYANIYWRKTVYEIDCTGDYVRLLEILNLKFKEWEGCTWLHNYVLNANPTRETVRI